MSTAIPLCEGFPGNPDLYGLGIRCGVYLQWVSTWLSISFEPQSAQETHSVNSIFVLAILIAVVQAASSSSLRPIEAIIMLQICYGYLFTVMSIFGLRIQLLGYARTARLAEAIEKFKKKIQEATQKNRHTEPNTSSVNKPFNKRLGRFLLKMFTFGTFSIPLSHISFLKDRHLSWAGVFWRSMISTFLVSCSFWFWYTGITTLALDESAKCVPVVFLFARLRLSHSTVIFYRVFTTLVAVLVYPLFWFLLAVLLRFISILVLSIYRQWFETQLELILPGSVDEVKRLMQKYSVVVVSASLGSLVVIPELGQIPPLKDALKMVAVVASSKRSMYFEGLNEQPKDRYRYLCLRPTTRYKILMRYSISCRIITVIAHVGTAMIITWFIICTELMIHWNQISGIDTINTTGQLIPFIIGVVSACRTLQRIALATIKKVGYLRNAITYAQRADFGSRCILIGLKYKLM
jgi:hypothetical protein